MEGNSSGIGSNTTRMLPSAQFWKCANSWRRNWRNRYQFESGLVFGFKRLSNEAMSVIGCLFGHGAMSAMSPLRAQKRTLTKHPHDGAGKNALLRISVQSATEN